MKTLILLISVLVIGGIAQAESHACYDFTYHKPEKKLSGQATLYTPTAYRAANPNFSPQLQPPENVFSLVDQRFCMIGYNFSQSCSRSTLRLEYLDPELNNNSIEFGVIGSEKGDVFELHEAFNDVTKNMAIGAALGPICIVGQEELVYGWSKRALKLSEINPDSVYVVRIHDIGYTKQDLIAKLQFKNDGDQGVQFIYEVLAIGDVTETKGESK